jgi:predicted DCC family thiol-disulfide oxidoreductase YuxK
MTEYKKNLILYDGACQVCLRMKGLLAPMFEKRGFHWEALQAEWVGPATGLSPAELMEEIKVLTDEGKVIGGVDAWIYLARFVWWMHPFYLLGSLPGFHAAFEYFYRAFAANRYCVGGTCRIGGD